MPGSGSPGQLKPGKTDVAALPGSTASRRKRWSRGSIISASGLAARLRLIRILPNKLTSVSGYDFVKGWGSPIHPAWC